MKHSENTKILRWAPARLGVTVAAAIGVGIAYILRAGEGRGMERVYYGFSRPYHAFMAKLCSHLPFSAAELFYALALGFLLVYITVSVVHIVRRKDKGRQVYITILTLLMICLLFWCAYSYLWTPYYYAPTFSQQSGVSDKAVDEADLESVTAYFAKKANEYGDKVSRDENGLFTADRDDIVARAAGVYAGVSKKWSFLDGEALRPKGIICSKIMSLTDFTGFFFPLTGEANLNMDSPVVMLPFTAEHELSHQRGTGMEQECNFIAAVACMDSGDADFEYSGALSAYIYLGNALYKTDRAAWKQIYGSLSQGVKKDLKNDDEYWKKYQDTLISKASDSAYESFLQGNGQELGLKSYGACVDLLVNYYKVAAAK